MGIRRAFVLQCLHHAFGQPATRVALRRREEADLVAVEHDETITGDGRNHNRADGMPTRLEDFGKMLRRDREIVIAEQEMPLVPASVS